MRKAVARLSARNGLTVLELLTVVGILALLFALLIPAVQQTRMAGLRIERANWKKQRFLGENTPRKLPIRILFIGNSYTETNDLPGMLVDLAKSEGKVPELIVDRHLVGGATLKMHWDDGVAVQKIREGDWDFVVLQEQSQTPLPQFGKTQLFYPAARQFVREIRDREAIPMFYMTWARPDTPGPQSLWTTSYAAIAKELSAECAPAGMAMEKAKQGLPHRTFFQDAGGHPTPETTYLIACVFYATIFDRTPEGLTNAVTTATGTVTVPPSDAVAMQRYAWEALQEVKKLVRPEWR